MARFISISLMVTLLSALGHAAITVEEGPVLDTDSGGFSPNLTALGTADWVLFGKSDATWVPAETKNVLQPLIAIDSQSTAGVSSSSNTDSNRFTWSDGKPTATGSDQAAVTRLQVSSEGPDIDTDITIAVSTLEAGKSHRFIAWLGGKRTDVNISYSIDGGSTFVGTQTRPGSNSSTTYEHQYTITYTPQDISDKLYVRFEWNLADGATGQQQALLDAAALNAPLNEAPDVDAGPRYQVGGISGIQLNGSYTDDGLPADGDITVQWSVVESDDPNYVLGDPNTLNATIAFETGGFCTLELTVNDGQISGSDQITLRAKDDALLNTLQAHFKCDSDANDLSDHYYQYESVVGSPEIVDGKVAGALQLIKGEKLTYGTQLGAETSFTVAFWMNPAADVESDSKKGIISKYSGNSGDPQGGWTFQYRSEDLMRFRCSSGYSDGAGDLKVEIPGLYPKGQWTHIVGTFDGTTGQMKFYVNSQLVAERTTGQTSFDPVTELQIGSDDWAGMVDDIFLYDYVISPAELRALFTRGGNAPPLVDIAAGQAKLILPDNEITLNGTVFDENAYTVAWTVEDGPGGVTFTPADAETTTVRFDAVGNYLIRMTATDDEGLSNYDEAVVKVRPADFDGMEAHITFAGKDPNSYLATGVPYRPVVAGAPSWTTRGGDDPNDAILLDGADDALDYGQYLGSDPQCTIMVWFKPADPTRNQFVLGKWSAGTSGDGWMIRIRGGGNLAAHIGSYFQGNGIYLTAVDPHTGDPLPLTAGEWTHAALTFDGDTMTLYQNGVPVRREEGIVGFTAGDVVTPMVVGYRTSTDAEYFDGAIDEIRVYDYALTAEEIKAIYTADGGKPWQTCHPQIAGDLNADCRVDLADAAVLGAGWQTDYDISTLADVAGRWLDCDDLDLSTCP